MVLIEETAKLAYLFQFRALKNEEHFIKGNLNKLIKVRVRIFTDTVFTEGI